MQNLWALKHTNHSYSQAKQHRPLTQPIPMQCRPHQKHMPRYNTHLPLHHRRPARKNTKSNAKKYTLRKLLNADL